MSMIETLFSSVIKGSNSYLTLLLLIIFFVYISIRMLSSGTIYRISISRADTNLNIIEKLKENKGLNLSPEQEKMCSDIITDSLINISTGYRLNSRNIHVYNHVLSITGDRYISNFAAKVKKDSEPIIKSTRKCFFTYFSMLIVSFLILTVSPVLLEHSLHAINLAKYTALRELEKILFFCFTILTLLFFLAYIISIIKFINSLILLYYCVVYKNIRNYIR